MKIQVLTAVHHAIPSTLMTAHFTTGDADAEALKLVVAIAADLPEDVEVPMPPANASEWRGYLRQVQNVIIDCRLPEGPKSDEGDEDDLAALSGCYVNIDEIEMVTPRLSISLDGGLVDGIVCDIPLDAYVVDYDTEGAGTSELYEIPQTDGEPGKTAEALVREAHVEVEPAFIDGVVAAFEAGPMDSDEEAAEPEND